jgi:hypothetical protein
VPGENDNHLFRCRESEQWCFDLRSLHFAHSLWHWSWWNNFLLSFRMDWT